MRYTAEDVQLAASAKLIKMQATAEETTPKALLHSCIDGELNPEQLEKEVADFERGAQILTEANLIVSPHRTVVPVLSNGELYKKFDDADSPTILLDAGYVATQQAWQAAALKAK